MIREKTVQQGCRIFGIAVQQPGFIRAKEFEKFGFLHQIHGSGKGQTFRKVGCQHRNVEVNNCFLQKIRYIGFFEDDHIVELSGVKFYC